MTQHLTASLRRTLESALVTDSDLDAFCIDYFPNVHRRFTRGMDRTAKLNVLLECISPAEIYPLLSLPADGAFTVGVSAPHSIMDMQIPAYLDERSKALGEQLHQLYERKEQRVVAAQDTSSIDQEILAVRRAQRLGHQLTEGEFLGQGRYRLLNRVGHGGFATVFRAYDRRDCRLVAIKILHSQWAQDRSRLERFIRGARRMGRLQHPAIVRVIGEYMEDSAFHYFVMDYLAGGDLRHAMKLGKVDVKRALDITLQVGEGLAFAHSRGLIHRDVKPGNILLSGQGDACLTDFDLVLAADSTGGTETGALGTFVYAAPEVMKEARTAGQPADVYSLGMTAIAAVSGEDLPVDAFRDTRTFIERLGVSPSIKQVLGRAVEWQIENRYQTIEAFTSGLRIALAAGPGPAQVPASTTRHGLLSTTASWPATARRGWIVAAAIALLLITVVAYAQLRARAISPAQQPTSEPAGAPHVARASPVTPAVAQIPAPPAERTISVQVLTLPAGADVRLENRKDSLGLTPWQGQIPAAPGKLAVVLSKRGYSSERLLLDARIGTTFTVRLKPLPTSLVNKPKLAAPEAGRLARELDDTDIQITDEPRDSSL